MRLESWTHAQGLGRYAEVVGLGGKEYPTAVEASFDGSDVSLNFLFSGLPISKAMGATKRARTRSQRL